MIRIIEPENYSLEAIRQYEQIDAISYGMASEADFDCTTIVIRINYNINSSFLDLFPNLKYIVSPTTGLTHIDLKELDRRNITLRCLRDVPDEILDITSTSEMALGLAIMINRRLGRLLAIFQLMAFLKID